MIDCNCFCFYVHAAKHRESHNRMPTYRHPITQMLLGRVNEWWTGAFYGNVPETDR